MDNIAFYEECARLLGTTYACAPFPYQRRTRWNNRAAGSGRFEGCGLIRVFGARVHVALRHPISLYRDFSSKEETLAALATLLNR